MIHKDKLKDQLVHESIGLRQRISDLEASETDRKGTHEHFWKAQEPFIGIYKYSRDGMAYASIEGVLLDVNDSFVRLTGYSREELLDGKKYQDITPDEYHDYEAEMVEHALRTGELVEYEKEYITKDGSRVPVLLTVFILRSTDGKPVALAAIIKDLAERRGMYEKSQKQAEQLKALYKDLDKRNRDLEILNTITQAVHQYVNLEEIYKVALDMTIALENVDMAMIYLVDDDRKEAIIQAHRYIPDEYIRRAGRIPYPKGITWKVINTGEILNVLDVQRDPDIGPAGRDLGPHGVLGIPITLDDKVIGVIWLFSYKAHRFDEQEVALLSSIGKQIAIAIAKAKLYREVSKKSRYETLISSVTQSVHESINLQEVLENAVKSMNANIDRAYTIAIYFIEENEAVLKAHRGLTDEYIKRAGRILYPKGATWKTIIEGNPGYCEDVELDKVIGPAGRKMGIKSYLCTPIQFQGKPVGSLNITSFSKNAFDKEELKLLSIVAQQIETAINNANQAEALRNSEERYRALYEDNPSMYFTVNSQGKILSVNEFGAEQLGYTAKELVGQSVLMVFHLDDQKKAQEQIAECLQNPRLTAQWESRKIAKDGRMLWVKEVGRAVQDAYGDIITLIVCEDITELKKLRKN
jgi:PAS domain S-box-containing protein